MIAYLSQIVEWACDEIIDANNVVIGRLREKVNTKVRTDETRPASYNNRFLHNEMKWNGMEWNVYLHNVIII